MHLTSIRLQNIACFQDLFLDCTKNSTGAAASWIVLIGENGTGKSTVLQMIGAALLGYRQLAAVAGGVDWRGYRRTTAKEDDIARYWVNLSPEVGDKEYRPGLEAETFYILRNLPLSEEQTSLNETIGPRVYDPVLDTALYTDSLTDGWFACGYSPWRQLAGRTGDGGTLPTLDESAKPFRFASLFGNGTGLTNVSDWLAGLYFQAIYPGHSEEEEKRFEIARAALLRTMPHMKSLDVTSRRQVIVSDGSITVPLERLSDGYRGTLAWVGDLIRRLFDAYPESSDPLGERGIVLVDEIDLHLHPKWQRSIVEDIRKLFPNIQFIVTTHSPFVAQDMRTEDRIIILEKSGSGRNSAVVAREDEGGIQDWSANQILSAYFGLTKGTRGEKSQRNEARYERLLDAEIGGMLTESQGEELNLLRTRMSAVPVGDTADEQVFYRTADAVIASLRSRRQELEAQKLADAGEDTGKDKETVP